MRAQVCGVKLSLRCSLMQTNIVCVSSSLIAVFPPIALILILYIVCKGLAASTLRWCLAYCAMAHFKIVECLFSLH